MLPPRPPATSRSTRADARLARARARGDPHRHRRGGPPRRPVHARPRQVAHLLHRRPRPARLAGADPDAGRRRRRPVDVRRRLRRRRLRAGDEGASSSSPATSRSCCRRNYIGEGDYWEGEYYLLLVSSVLGMTLMASARDLITIFVALELLSIPAYLLAGWRKRELTGNEAGLKYYLMGVFASAVMLYGMSLIYGGTGSTVLADDRRADERQLRRLAGRRPRHRVRARRLRLQGVGGAVPQLGARHLRGRAHPGHRVPLGRLEGGRLRGDHGADLRRLLRPRRRVRADDVGPGRAHDDRRQPHRPAPDERRAPVRVLVGRPGRVHPRPAGRGRRRSRRSRRTPSRRSSATSSSTPR